MRANVRAFCELAVEHFQLDAPVYEFGSYQVAGQEDRANLRSLFPGKSYVGCDMRAGPGVDRVEDLAGLKLPDGCAATVLCFDTLEHTFDVHQACREMFRVLRPGGMLLLSAPFHFRIHAYPDDYWRITPSALLRLLDPYGAALVGYQGAAKTPHTVMALAVKRPIQEGFAQQALGVVDAFQHWLGKFSSCGLVSWLRRQTEMIRRSQRERGRLRAWHEAGFVIHCSHEAANAREPSLAATQTRFTAQGV